MAAQTDQSSPARPFFSILLPTKNRSEIVGGAIESALGQTFPDFELIISDNDDSDTATAAVVRNYADSRIRYFRTSGKLAMHENWENALSLARGEHVLILEDKIRFVDNALEILRHYLQKLGKVVLSFDLRFTREAALPGPTLYPPVEKWRTEDAIDLFCNFSQQFFNLHPKSLDSSAPLEVLQRAKLRSPTGLVYSYICPDYASGFLLLSEVESFYFIKAPLAYVPNNWMGDTKYSNGQATYKKTALTRRFLKELPVSEQAIRDYVPIKSHWLWINMVLFDFFTKYKATGAQPRVNWIEYHAFCIILLILGRRLGAEMAEERKAIADSLRKEPALFKIRVWSAVARRVAQNLLLAVKNRLSSA